MYTGPLVSIILPSYNYAHFLSEAIKSILNQTYQNWELIIIDDASEDESLELARSFEVNNPDKIRLISLPSNHGLKLVIKMGISAAKGRYIAFLEADDFWQQESLEKRIIHLLSTKASLVYSDVETIGPEIFWKQLVDKSLQSKRRFSSQMPKVFSNSSIFFKNYIPTFSCVLADKVALEQLDYLTPLDYRLDHWLWTQLSMRGTFSYLNERLTFWRVHEGSYTFTHQKNDFDKKQLEYSHMLLDVLLKNSGSTKVEIERWLRKDNTGQNLIRKTLASLEAKRIHEHIFWKFIINVKDLIWIVSVRLKRKISSIKSKTLGKTA
jgi:glycosyltransferase involved in cell wall biosynthesis